MHTTEGGRIGPLRGLTNEGLDGAEMHQKRTLINRWPRENGRTTKSPCGYKYERSPVAQNTFAVIHRKKYIL